MVIQNHGLRYFDSERHLHEAQIKRRATAAVTTQACQPVTPTLIATTRFWRVVALEIPMGGRVILGLRLRERKGDRSEQCGFGTDRGRIALGFTTSARLLLLLLRVCQPPCGSEGFLRNKQGKHSAYSRPPLSLREKSGCGGSSVPKHTGSSSKSSKNTNTLSRCRAPGADWTPCAPYTMA